jgi:hypothetical protein
MNMTKGVTGRSSDTVELRDTANTRNFITLSSNLLLFSSIDQKNGPNRRPVHPWFLDKPDQ